MIDSFLAIMMDPVMLICYAIWIRWHSWM